MAAFLTAADAVLLTPFVGGSLFVATCVVVWVARYERQRRNRVQAIIEARDLANIRTLAHIEESEPELAGRIESVWRSGAYRRNFATSPANRPVVPYVGFFCPDCGQRLDKADRPCPMGPHDRSAA